MGELKEFKMANLYSKWELKHLKWKLMNQEGLSEKQASDRIAELLDFSQSLHKENSKKQKNE